MSLTTLTLDKILSNHSSNHKTLPNDVSVTNTRAVFNFTKKSTSIDFMNFHVPILAQAKFASETWWNRCQEEEIQSPIKFFARCLTCSSSCLNSAGRWGICCYPHKISLFFTAKCWQVWSRCLTPHTKSQGITEVMRNPHLLGNINACRLLI